MNNIKDLLSKILDKSKILEILANNNVKLPISDKQTRIVHSDTLKVYTIWPSRRNDIAISMTPSLLRHLLRSIPLSIFWWLLPRWKDHHKY